MLFQPAADGFVGRKEEIEYFITWLTSPTSPWILYFYDALEEEEKKGGVGKTWLLRRCAELARDRLQATVVMIDFFNVADRDGIVVAEHIVKELQASYPEWSPQAFATALQEYRSPIESENIDVEDLKQKISDAFTTDLRALEGQLLARKTYLLIFFDTFEVVERNPTVAVLYPGRPFPDNYHFEHIRVVMAGRNSLDWTHPNWLRRESEVACVALAPFSQQEMIQYLDTKSIYQLDTHNERSSSLYSQTNGRPILLGLIKDVLNQRILTLDELVAILPTNFEPYLVAQINMLENPLNWVVLFMAHVYHRFNARILEWIMQALHMQELEPYADSTKLLAILPTLSFIRYPGYGTDFVLHDEMRRLVVKYCWDVQDPDFGIRKEISRHMVSYYELEMAHAQNEQERRPYTIEILYHLLYVDLIDGLAFFQKVFSQATSLLMTSFARSLLLETRLFWKRMSQAQHSDLLLLETKLLRLEERSGQALDLCQELERDGDKQWLIDHYAEFLFEKGKCYQNMSKLPEAMSCLTECLEIERVRGNERQCAAILSSLGYIYRRVGQLDMAVYTYRESMILYKELSSPRDYANILNSISNVYRIQGKIENALQMCKIAWRIRINLFNQGRAPEVLVGDSLSMMGRIYIDANDILQAESLFQEAFEIYQRKNYKKGIVITYGRFGQIQLAKDNLREAKMWFEKAQAASVEVDMEVHIQSLNRQGRIFSMQKKRKESIIFFEQAIDFAQLIHDHYQHAENLMDLANVLGHLGSQDLSQHAFQVAREISHRENYIYLSGRVEVLQGDLKYNADEHQNAFEHYREYCRYMALYNTIEYSTALRKLIDRLSRMAQAEISLITSELTAYWIHHQLDKDYPELISICQDSNNLMIF
jgi:tetratricopeptide (TPR) repeat protein